MQNPVKKLFLLFLAVTISNLACEQKKKEKDENSPIVLETEIPVIEAKKTPVEPLLIAIEERQYSLVLHISGIPGDDNELTCLLDESVLSDCHDGMHFNKPSPGDHELIVTAKNGETLQAIGDEKFTIHPKIKEPEIPPSQENEQLNLMIDIPDFTNGMPWPLAKNLNIKFKLAHPRSESDSTEGNQCTITTQCRVDRLDSNFWRSCDESGFGFSLQNDELAAGLQYFSAQATCGDSVGPIMSIFWYGVPHDYEPLGIQPTVDSKRKYLFQLVKESDCPDENARKYFCAPAEIEDFDECSAGNVLHQPKVGDRIRLHCNDKVGPEFTIQ